MKTVYSILSGNDISCQNIENSDDSTLFNNICDFPSLGGGNDNGITTPLPFSIIMGSNHKMYTLKYFQTEVRFSQ